MKIPTEAEPTHAIIIKQPTTTVIHNNFTYSVAEEKICFQTLKTKYVIKLGQLSCQLLL